MAELLYRKTQL